MPGKENPIRRGNHFGASNKNSAASAGRVSSGASGTPSETSEFTRAYYHGGNPRPRDGKRATRTPQANHISTVSPPVRQTRTIDSASFQRPPRKRGKGKVAAAIIAAAIAVIIVVGGITGFTLLNDARGIMSKVDTLISQKESIKTALAAGDSEMLIDTASYIADQVFSIHKTTNGLNWTVASFIPIIGQDISSARTLVSEMDTLCQQALLPSVSSLTSLQDGGIFVNGAINVEQITTLVDTLQTVAPTIQASSETINALPDAHIGKLAEAINMAKSIMGTADTALTQINELAPYIPQMLGADGQTRSYLIVAQNNAENRSIGGFPGSAGVLTVNNGALSLGDFSALNGVMHPYDDPTHLATQEEIAIFQERVGTKPWDASFIVDFGRAATIYSTAWSEQYGVTIDGVVAIDPVFLQSLLQFTGGITTSSGLSVDGSNAVTLLQHSAYLSLGTEQQDSFFSEVAGAAFGNIISGLGDVNPLDLVTVVNDAIKDRHLLCWMANADEQNVMVQIGCSGTLGSSTTSPELGVFLSDDTISKMGWSLSTCTSITSEQKNADGSTTYTVETKLRNNITAEEATPLPQNITGYNPAKHSTDDIMEWVYLVAPTGGSISDVQISGIADATNDTTYLGHQLWYGIFHLHAQETTTLTYRVATSPDAVEPLSIAASPTLQEYAGWQDL